MTTPATLRIPNADVGTVFLKWLREQRSLRLVLVEGLPSAGKSALCEHGTAAGYRTIEVDKLLVKAGPSNIPWTVRARQEGALGTISTAIANYGVVIVEGPAIWPLLQDVVAELGRDVCRRVYIKRMSTSGGVVEWLDGKGLIEEANGREPFWREIYLHHGQDQPWKRADLIIERIDEDPTPESVLSDLLS